MRGWVTLCLAAVVVHSCALRAQQCLSHPERLAGRWEARDGRGMHLEVATAVATAGARTGPQQVVELEVGVYQRHGSDVNPYTFQFFSTGPDGGVTWDGRTLTVGRRLGSKVRIALTWNEASARWTGTWDGPGQHGQIVLRRPAAVRRSPFVGTWRDTRSPTCLHIVQASDGSFGGWTDVLFPSRVRYPAGVKAPERVPEHYGQIATVAVRGTHIDVKLAAYTAFCCPHPFSATTSRDGSTLKGQWPAGPNQSGMPAIWKRLSGRDCEE